MASLFQGTAVLMRGDGSSAVGVPVGVEVGDRPMLLQVGVRVGVGPVGVGVGVSVGSGGGPSQLHVATKS